MVNRNTLVLLFRRIGRVHLITISKESCIKYGIVIESKAQEHRLPHAQCVAHRPRIPCNGSPIQQENARMARPRSPHIRRQRVPIEVKWAPYYDKKTPTQSYHRSLMNSANIEVGDGITAKPKNGLRVVVRPVAVF